jgi:DMSO/TMAO reductase YedYZ molybdopterin-dependent catalytic subunit
MPAHPSLERKRGFAPSSFFRRIPLAPHQMRDRLTRNEDAVVLCHLGVPRLDREQWSLTIDGLVERPLTLRFNDLERYPKAVVTSFHQCAGNPLQPFEPTRRVCNITWGGARLADLLADCRVNPRAKYVWSYGADFGEFEGVAIDAYVKDLPMARLEADVLVAYEMNGDALPAEHGFPARLVVPGFYGTNSVKWLTRMTLAESRASGPFTTRWYNDPVLDDAGRETGDTKPVWSIAPESLIVSPAPTRVSSARSSSRFGVGPGPTAALRASTSGSRMLGCRPSSSPRADANGSASRCPGSRGTRAPWFWLRKRKRRTARASRYPGSATRSTACP